MRERQANASRRFVSPRSLTLMAAAAACLGGCGTARPPAAPAVASQSGGSSPPVMPPTFEVGAGFVFDDGRDDQVTAVSDDLVHWTDGDGLTFVTSRDILQPRIAWSERNGEARRSIHDQSGSLWPLAVGYRVSFQADRQVPGERAVLERWSCAVDTESPLETKAGRFDVWRVVCDLQESGEGTDSRSERVFYYAPAIGYYVRRDDVDADQAARTIELVDFRTADPALPPPARRARSAALQSTLETKPSGAAAVWRSRDGEAEGEVSPTRTYRLAMGHYCRDYEERINWQGRRFRMQATACRDRRGHWLSSPEIDTAQQSSSLRAIDRGG